MKNQISIKEIAALANVSTATISRVINHKGGYSAQTEERVQKIIKEHGYMPDLIAKSLRTSRNAIIGILVPDITNEYFSTLVLELQKAFFQEGYLTMVCNTNESLELEKQYLTAMIGQKVSGLVLASGVEANLKPTGVPTIYIGRKPRGSVELDDDILFVESDNIEGGYLATKELLEKGCRNIAFITDVLKGSSKTERYQGYCNALMEAGVEIEPSLILKADQQTTEAVQKVIWRYLDEGGRIDGIMCVTDMLAMGAITALQEKGVRIPEDIKVTGFDDISSSRYFNVPITTIHQYNDKMAAIVSELLFGRINGERIEDTRREIPVTLVKRRSTE